MWLARYLGAFGCLLFRGFSWAQTGIGLAWLGAEKMRGSLSGLRSVISERGAVWIGGPCRFLSDNPGEQYLVYFGSSDMLTVNIHEAKTHLSRLIDQVVRGEPFIIAKAGKPLVTVMSLTAPEPGQVKRLGFMAGQINAPDDFDRMGGNYIEQVFGSEV